MYLHHVACLTYHGYLKMLSNIWCSAWISSLGVLGHFLCFSRLFLLTEIKSLRLKRVIIESFDRVMKNNVYNFLYVEICFIFLCFASNFCVNTSFFSVRFLRACLYSLWHQCLYTVLNNSFPCLLLVRCYSLLILKSLLPNFFLNEISSKNVCLKSSPVKVSMFTQYQQGSTKTKCFWF